ncbi:hypothetical protein CDAR_500791 [Caerostris darwini]|uniref:Uncharacterized protein n=1 Tax=Caerostris darwini TaxID=1538125 RepID=A0AAV4USM0_9ARAC|nr:hypothetical protein CDAR_500791 [Caerostris darwini]
MSVNTALHTLVKSPENKLEQIRDFLKIGSNINKRDIDGNTPLHLAALNEKENEQIIEELISAGAQLNIANNIGNTPLHFVVIRRKQREVATLMENGADVNLKDDKGNTALHYAIDNCAALKRFNYRHVCPPNHQHGDYTFVMYLLVWGADVAARNRMKESALMMAVRCNDRNSVKILLQFDASVLQENLKNKMPMHFAFDHPQPNMFIILDLIDKACTKLMINYMVDPIVKHIMDKHEGDSDAQLADAKILVKCKVLVFRNTLLPIGTHYSFLPDLRMFATECLLEVQDMMTKYLNDVESIYSYVMRNILDVHMNFHSDVPHGVFKLLLEDRFPIYHDFILLNYEKSFLEGKLNETGMFVRRQSDEEKIILCPETISSLSSFLSHSDLFHLIKAFSNLNV